jgi:hypothetical protein
MSESSNFLPISDERDNECEGEDKGFGEAKSFGEGSGAMVIEWSGGKAWELLASKMLARTVSVLGDR